MQPKHKVYLKLNLMSLFFLALSFVSITLAWFAYSGLATVSTEIGVQAWYIEFEKNSQVVSNDIVISLDEVYPGMETYSEKVQIKNKGDSLASLEYEISSARILNEEKHSSDYVEGYLEDQLSHEYPFHINISLSKSYVPMQDGVSEFEVSISWPLDSNNDQADSDWGNDAYLFTQEEKAKAQADSNYQERSPLRIVINVTAEQFVESEDAVDINYNLGDVVLYDVINNQPCSQLSDSCIKTYVIDTDNKLGDDNVNLLPDLYDSYAEGTFDQYSSNLTAISNNWNVTTRSLKVQDLLKIISLDVVNSIRGNDVFSDMIIGNMSYGTRIDSEITRMSAVNSYYKYLNERFPFLSTSKCYWLDNEYNSTKSFAFSKLDDTYSIVEGKDKSTTCSVVPVIIASKSSFN